MSQLNQQKKQIAASCISQSWLQSISADSDFNNGTFPNQIQNQSQPHQSPRFPFDQFSNANFTIDLKKSLQIIRQGAIQALVEKEEIIQNIKQQWSSIQNLTDQIQYLLSSLQHYQQQIKDLQEEKQENQAKFIQKEMFLYEQLEAQNKNRLYLEAKIEEIQINLDERQQESELLSKRLNAVENENECLQEQLNSTRMTLRMYECSCNESEGKCEQKIDQNQSQMFYHTSSDISHINPQSRQNSIPEYENDIQKEEHNEANNMSEFVKEIDQLNIGRHSFNANHLMYLDQLSQTSNFKSYELKESLRTELKGLGIFQKQGDNYDCESQFTAQHFKYPFQTKLFRNQSLQSIAQSTTNDIVEEEITEITLIHEELQASSNHQLNQHQETFQRKIWKDQWIYFIGGTIAGIFASFLRGKWMSRLK